MTQAIDPDKEATLNRFRFNFITGELSYSDGSPLYSHIQHRYKWVWFESRMVGQHQIAWLIMSGAWPAEDVDHINRDKSCNTWINLRAATRGQNCQNRGPHKNNICKIKGLRFRPKDGFWEPRIMKDGAPIYLGIYKSLEDAIAARKAAELRYFTHA